MHPTDPNNVLVGTIRFGAIHERRHDAEHPHHQLGQRAEGPPGHARRALLAQQRNRFWVGSDGGLWRTDDGGSNFVNLNTNLNLTQFYDVAIDPDDPTPRVRRRAGQLLARRASAASSGT